jgi:hypothetical protein
MLSFESIRDYSGRFGWVLQVHVCGSKDALRRGYNYTYAARKMHFEEGVVLALGPQVEALKNARNNYGSTVSRLNPVISPKQCLELPKTLLARKQK